MLWKYMGWKGPWLHLLVLTSLYMLCTCQKIGDPYKILGIHPKASLPEIRKAYRQLAKEWHPDKSGDPNAESRFVEIKQAYELLSDTERRHAYDLYGITNEDDHMYKPRHDYSEYARFSNDPFEEFISRHFRTQDQDITLFHKLSVTSRHFENNIVEKSVHTPALVLFYTDFCFDCVRAAGAWRRLVEALQPLGLTLGTVHAGHEAALARRVRIPAVPCLTLVIDKHVHIYRDDLQSITKIFEFMRWKFPYKLVKSITDSNAEGFVSDFEDNKVKALIFEGRHTMRLRYLLAAYHYRDRVAFGFVDMTAPDTSNVTARYKVQPNADTMVLLKEESAAPAATVSTGEIPTQTLRDLIDANQMLTLPRLSSQSVLETVCPAEYRAARRRLCCVLLVGAGREGAAVRAQLRRLARAAPERIHYAYVYTHRQTEFVNALANGSGSDSSAMEHRIVIIWRRDPKHVQYEWLNHTWPSEPPHRDDILKYQERLNETERALQQLIKRLLRPTETMAYETSLQELADEAAVSFAWAAWAALAEWGERGAHALRGQRAASVLSALATLALLLGAGCLVQYLVRLEEESVSRVREERRRGGGGARRGDTAELRLHELRKEKYNGLVRLLKPGCRTIVILVDAESRTMLLSKFHKTVWPYRKNKTLLFAYLMVERNISWFRRVLQLSLGGTRELRVNARHCVGTVLALNPHRNYFCIYHATHPESKAKHHRMRSMTRSLGAGLAADPEAGAFIGFHSDESSADEQPDPILTENLLDGLDNWLDRLFEGSTHRYYINYWPDMTTK
ncbi:dnaJ homolog subfamily C member 16 isoform X3 [Plutella xylostella]|uniref:dnaJ homolog subfamily C member 16 isoform X2 n=1 Tax=Plutella xylostella TaxID=51655 RepID=UPI002032DDF5|nr:dnaJ homolog subfamily C member 16 isoform X2 [Plutella xylostella]XP_048479392.1 dnaJ homolog subfamily C member 16 isoform X3 [Plutella xylostella]